MGRWLAGVTVVVALVACGPSLEPIGEEPADTPADTAAGGAVDGCRPPLDEDDPHPIDGGGDQHPALDAEWVYDIAGAVQGEHPDVLAGVWLDNDAGELVVMVPGSDGREVFERLRTEAPEPERVVCMEATHTQDELLDLQRRASERLADTGTPMSSGVDTVRNLLELEFEGDLSDAEEALGELADHPAVRLAVPDCAEVVPPPEGATPLPGGGSNCQGMDALFVGVLAGDPSAGCAWIENEAGEPTTVVWPRGWSITEDGTVLDHRGEPRATIGDRVESGGGNVPLQEGQRACGIGGEEGAWVVSSLTRAEDAAGEE